MNRESTIAAAVVSVAVIIMLGVLTALVILRTTPFFEWQTTYLNMVGGGFVAAFTTVVGYWLGSSIGSKSKDEAMVDSLRRERDGPRQ